VSISQVLSRLDIKVAQQTKVHQDRVANCLQSLGWQRRRLSLNGEKYRPWAYVAPGVKKVTKQMKEQFVNAAISPWGGVGGAVDDDGTSEHDF
jgi:hypothetical protein